MLSFVRTHPWWALIIAFFIYLIIFRPEIAGDIAVGIIEFLKWFWGILLRFFDGLAVFIQRVLNNI